MKVPWKFEVQKSPSHSLRFNKPQEKSCNVWPTNHHSLASLSTTPKWHWLPILGNAICYVKQCIELMTCQPRASPTNRQTDRSHHPHSKFKWFKIGFKMSASNSHLWMWVVAVENLKIQFSQFRNRFGCQSFACIFCHTAASMLLYSSSIKINQNTRPLFMVDAEPI